MWAKLGGHHCDAMRGRSARPSVSIHSSGKNLDGLAGSTPAPGTAAEAIDA